MSPIRENGGPDTPLNGAHHHLVLFVDISGSTRLYEELGNVQAHARIENCLQLLQRIAREFRGRVIKRTGDGLMCAFSAADDALHAARTMQVKVVEANAAGGPALGIHVGCHSGPVIEKEGDLYGDAVNVASRVAGLAKVGQIILTQEVVQLLGPLLRMTVRYLDRVPVKGKRDPLAILEYVWGDSEGVTMLAAPVTERRRRLKLKLVSGERTIWFDGSNGEAVSLGRDTGSDITISDRMASRQHARIEKRRDKFFLVDHSWNGTYVAMPGEAEICLRREELMLRAQGQIALGQSTRNAGATIVEFVCEWIETPSEPP